MDKKPLTLYPADIKLLIDMGCTSHRRTYNQGLFKYKGWYHENEYIGKNSFEAFYWAFKNLIGFSELVRGLRQNSDIYTKYI